MRRRRYIRRRRYMCEGVTCVKALHRGRRCIGEGVASVKAFSLCEDRRFFRENAGGFAFM